MNHRYEVIEENRRVTYTNFRSEAVSTALAWARESGGGILVSSAAWVFGTPGDYQRDHLIVHATDRQSKLEGLLVQANAYYGAGDDIPPDDGDGLPVALAA